MLPKTLTSRTILAYVAVNAFFVPIVAFWYFDLIGIGGTQVGAGVLFAMVVLSTAVCAARARSELEAYEACLVARDSERSPALVLRADAKLQGLAARFGAFFATSWAAMFTLTFVILKTQFGNGLLFSSSCWEVTAMAFVGLWCGSFCVGAPLMALLTDSAAGHCSAMAREFGIPLPRAPESLQTRIGTIALVLALGPSACVLAVGHAKQVEQREQQNGVLGEVFVARLAERFEPRSSPSERRQLLAGLARGVAGVRLALLDRRGRPLATSETGEFEVSEYAQRVVKRLDGSPGGLIRDSGRAARTAFRRLDPDTIGVAQVEVPAKVGGYAIGALLIVIVIALWAPFSAILLGRAMTRPIERLISTTEKIVEEGNQSEVAALPVVRNDEIGRLSARFNDLLEVMRDLSRAADAIASGKLELKLSRKGELPDAFRRMLESLRGMVREVRGTSVDLASAATEILAASQEQESAAASQSSAMEEISRTMDSLSASAAHVADSVQGVLANAERTMVTSDQMLARIAELSGHANRIGEILDVIREIADRTDLLALNGSLEASRAGESGHGFALVAAEMRRLAERVTASVQDVKSLVNDIRDSGSSTMAASEEGRRLLDGTTEAARQITFVSQQQRSGTEQVSASIRNIADVVTQAVSATAQTRTSAQGLKAQADRLASVVQRFEIEQGEAT